MLEFEKLCREICELDRSILFAAAIEDAELLCSHFKKPMAPPNERRFRVLRIQTELMLSMAMENEDFFGDVSYLMFHSKLLDVFLFPLGKGRKRRILAVGLKRPYSHDVVADKILSEIQATRS